MISSTLYVRIVSQDRDRGYMLLVGYDSKIVQSTAIQIITLSVLTRESLDKAIASVKHSYHASEVKDVTAEGITKKLKKMFGEVDAKPVKEKKDVSAS